MPIMTRELVERVITKGRSARVDEQVPPKFKAGDRIVVRNFNPPGHTRNPRYIRGKRGVIGRDHGVFVFPDTNAHGQGVSPQHVYSVRFEGQEVWGADAQANTSLYLDLWDDYLELA